MKFQGEPIGLLIGPIIGREAAEDPQADQDLGFIHRDVYSEGWHPEVQDSAIMDDSRTQRTLDALADLYLTGTSPGGGGPGSTPLRLPPKLRVRQGPQTSSPENPSNQSSKPASIASDETGDLSTPSGPARPWRQVRQERRAQQAAQEAAAQARESQSPESESADNQFDDGNPLPFVNQALSASGFMDDDGAAISEEPGVIHSQAVFLGNLPGFAGPWLAQYAQQLAMAAKGNKPAQGVAILHVSSTAIDLEVVYPLGVTPPAAVKPAALKAGQSLIDVLDPLVQDAKQPLSQWLIHLASPSDEAMLRMGRDLDHWTLLTGADDAAVVAGSQWLDKMLQGDSRAMQRRVGVAVMGCDEAKAQAVVDRVAGAAHGLTQGVTLAATRKQMAPVNIRSLGSFTPTDELWQEVLSYLSAWEPPAAAMAGPAREGEEDVEPAQPSFAIPDERKLSLTYARPAEAIDESLAVDDTDDAEASEFTPEDADYITPNHHHAQDHVHAQSQQVEAQAHASETTSDTTTATQTVTQTASAVSSAASLDLTQWLPAGTQAMEARSPRQPSVELAVDPQGRLHLSARTGMSLREAAMELQAAAIWAQEHHQLLQLTHRHVTLDTQATPAMHLFTDQSIAGAKLADQVADNLKVHLLLEARVGQSTTWVAAPLN